MEKQQSNSKIVLSIIFSCTKNVILAVLGLFLCYFLLNKITNNWSSIWGGIVGFSQLWIPVVNFAAEHMLALLIPNVLLFVWLICIVTKLENKEIKIPSILYILLFLLLLSSGALLLISGIKLLSSIFSFFACILGVVILFLSTCIIISFIVELCSTKEPVETQNSPQQLDLFEDNK